MSLLDSGPKLDWTRDNQIFLRYKQWKAKVELIFRSALSQATPEEKTSYLKYWMGDPGLPLIEKWETTGKLDYSNPNTTPTKEGGRSRPLSSGFKLETYWKLLEEEFKPKGNKLLSIIELWTQSRQGPKTLNEWLTYIHNLAEACNYGDSTDRIIRDVLIIGCESSIAKDKIIRKGETITLNEVIEILQIEASTNSTLRQFQEIQNKPMQQELSVNYVSYDSRSKKSKKPSNEQNSSSSTGPTGAKRKCFRCGEPYSRKHLQECRAQNVTCDGCGIKGHYKKCCKKTGNFPRDNSNRENQSPSTGNMRYTSAVPLQADYFDERGIHKEYRSSSSTTASNATRQHEYTKESTQSKCYNSFRRWYRNFYFSSYFRFPLYRISVHGSSNSISNRFFQHFRHVASERKQQFFEQSLPRYTDLTLKSGQNSSSYEEMREIRDPTVSSKHTQSTRDPTTITNPGNSNFRKSTPGTNILIFYSTTSRIKCVFRYRN